MNDTKIALKQIEAELGEWQEELGDQFPSFLNHVLMTRLLRAKEEVEFLRRCLSSNEVCK